MTTPAVSAHVPARTATGARRGPTFPRVLAAEWTKVTSLRSTVAIVVATVAVSGGLTYLGAKASSTDPGFDPIRSVGDGLPLAVVGPLVLAVLVGTGEHGTGTFRSTFTAVPRRLPVLAAQTVVTAVLALLTAVLAVGAAVLGLLPAGASRGMTPDLASDGTPQVLAGTVAYLVGTGLFGFALGALLRRTVPAVVAAVVLVLVLPVALMLATDFSTDPLAPVDASTTPAIDPVTTVVTLLPGGAGSLVATPGSGRVDGAPDLGPGGGALVLAGWVAVPLAAAAYRLRRRDLV